MALALCKKEKIDQNSILPRWMQNNYASLFGGGHPCSSKELLDDKFREELRVGWVCKAGYITVAQSCIHE